VGVAIQWPGYEEHYFSWGHPTNNNCTRTDGIRQLRAVWDSHLPIVCHHAKFDTAVAYERMELPHLPWNRVHDTMFLAYLCDPHARSLGLKELAADMLQWPATEQDELNDWIWNHRASLEATYGGTVSKKKLGAWIWATPADLCGRYAVGDVQRTMGLFQHLWPLVQKNGMGAAYDRERQLMPILQENEEQGIRVDLAGLDRDIDLYGKALSAAVGWLRRELRASGLNFDADQDVAAILIERGIVPPDKWQRTKPTKSHPNGQLSVSKENLLPEHFTDPRIASVMGYRNRLVTCLNMFMSPWQEQAALRGGRISTNWNQVRNPEGGTRTGRPSTTDPNFLNISKDFEGRDDGYVHPAFLGVAALPLVRKYVLPDEGEVFLHRDFDGQELRVFAHFEQGDLYEKFHENPALDPHKFVGAELMRVAGREIERTKVKVLNFQSLYGGGVPALQRKLRCTYAEGKELKAFHNKALPGRVILNEEIKRIVNRGDPIRTWGGRLYYPEAPGEDGRSKIYKLINYEIQGSAADITKQTIIDWYNAKGRGGARFLVTVYDEINVSALPGRAPQDMKLLRDVMEARRLTVPMRSSPKHGLTWGDSKKCPPEKGCQLCQ
jgi:DNA polymerase I-like protein with 3'-5' exonuclease and polymerase domains